LRLRFLGKIEELKERLKSLERVGEWKEIHGNQYQFRAQNGAIFNWFPNTGSINFQGSTEFRGNLEEDVANLLNSSNEDLKDIEEKLISTKINNQTYVNSGVEYSSDRDSKPCENQGNGTVVSDTKLTLGNKFKDSELVIALVGAVGTELQKVARILKERLKAFKYIASDISISQDVIPKITTLKSHGTVDEFTRISQLMDAGNQARKDSGDDSILALGCAKEISDRRGKLNHRSAYIVRSLKHPSEVQSLREIYSNGFYLIGVHSEEKRRQKYLVEEKLITNEQAEQLMLRDEDEHTVSGQRVTDTFHLSDFFVRISSNEDQLKKSIWRILDILFGNPYRTPTFDEYAMFLAFSASLRSADLSRQVGAVVSKNCDVLSTGANDSPKFGGGLYWPELNSETHEIIDKEGGRDHTLGCDSNKSEQRKIIEDILADSVTFSIDKEDLERLLERSRIKDLTEYGRVVHAEMEALLACTRNGISTKAAHLYCTTFPCHNCAKHIIAAGFNRVVFIEPYQKSKALDFHVDSVKFEFSSTSLEPGKSHVSFEPFVGVGPRRFFDLFSMRLGVGYELRRKDRDGQIVKWETEKSKLRVQMLPYSYVELEQQASSVFNSACPPQGV
jgi:deoxycytidylate deaminase